MGLTPVMWTRVGATTVFDTDGELYGTENTK